MHPIRFLMIVAAASVQIAQAAGAPVISGIDRAALSDAAQGRVLLAELNCTACHAVSGQSKTPGGPDLSQAGARTQVEPLRRFIASPSDAKPGTTMPDLLGHLPAADREEAALALAHFVASLGHKPMTFDRPAADAVERGKALYHSVGCVACHSPEQWLADSVPLGPLAEKYSVASLAELLKNPLAARPSGRMPDMKLGHFEALDIASYLLRDQPAGMKSAEPDVPLAAKGRELFAKLNCVACHAGSGVAGNARELPPVDRGQLDAGCLASTPGTAPRFGLSAAQRGAIHAALSAPAEPLKPDEQIAMAFAQLNCVACHQRDGHGGPDAARNPFFTGADENLGDQGRIPPPLTGVGAKLRREALRDVLVNGGGVRPYLHTRMPRFGAANVEPLVELFKQADTLEKAEFKPVREAKLARDAGRELAGSKGMNCVACHTFREKSAAPIRALDLMTMTERLEENWFHHYMAAPQKFSPLTIMPAFWPDGKSTLPEVLGGDPGAQRHALWTYLAGGPEAGEPRGIVLEPLVVEVRDEAVMLRRNYPGIGKRGIGVGYPSGVSLSFDAGQMRLASVWSGGFIEASGVWRGQGSGQVRVLGADAVKFPEGAAFAILESPATPWPTNNARQAEGFQFKGYTLDAKRRPTFRYEFGGVLIEDQFEDVNEPTGRAWFRRTLSFPSGSVPANLHLRVAADAAVTATGNEYAAGRRLRVRLPAPGVIRAAPGGQELLLPIASARPVTLEYRWEPEVRR